MILERAQSIRGTLRVPGDKSIAHRALILGTLARGKHVVEGVPHADDVSHTIRCLQRLGAFIEEMPDGRTLVISRDVLAGGQLDAGNSGTTARLLSGLVAGMNAETTIDGDESLRRRPMARISRPLEQMGAGVSTTDGHLPMTIRGGRLTGIRYTLPVASAQVKSAILIAGLLAEGDTVVEEPVATRDHTERLLRAMSARIECNGRSITVHGNSALDAVQVKVPGDVSSAAFFMVAATCLPASELYFPTTGVNPTRTGALRVLEEMGASIERVTEDTFLEEPVADIVVKSRPLHGVTIAGDMIPTLIDELPILAVAATQAEGETVVRNAEELRHKESDRIRSIVDNLKLMGSNIEARKDGFVVRGPTPLHGARVSAHSDHRIAMALAIAGVLAEGKTEIEDSDVVGVSYPSFFRDLTAMLR